MSESWQSLWPGVTSWEGWSTGEIGIVVIIVAIMILSQARR